MTQLSRFLLFIIAIASASCVSASKTEIPLDEIIATDEQRSASIIVTQVLKRFHYLQTDINDDLSSQMLDHYIESLDPNRHFFLKSDIDTFNHFRYELDEALKAGKLEIAFEIFKTFREKVEDRSAFAITLLKKPFDFSVKETFLFDREEADWPQTMHELDDIWRKRVKNDYLTLKLSGKKHDEIAQTLTKRYEGVVRRTKQLHTDDIFQLFINALTLVIEPHTAYMSARTAENFDINMRLSLEGIGAVLTNENEFTKIQSVIAGGPAEKSGLIKAGDLITGVGQDIDGDMQDVVGWSLSDVVDKIRGAKGSIVRLMVVGKNSGADAPAREVVIVRDEIKLEDQAAHSEVLEDVEGLQGKRIGVIEVPAFYRDFDGQVRGDADFRSTTRDVKKLLKELQAKNVDGILIDLRNNGGGSLTEATELTGLFIKEGPVVQVRESGGDVSIEKDEDDAVYYDGPLAVLVNRNSASASEIFAGAIQDYNRGVIIGEPTFGKGTVQTLVDLAKMIRSSDNLGRLRLTMAQFFRVNGGSTQHKGVVPDIVYPTAKWISDHGERSLEHALPWASIDPLDYDIGNLIETKNLRENSEQRIKKDPGFQFLEAQEKLLETIREEKVVSLNEQERKLSWDRREELRKQNRNRFRQSLGIKPIAEDISEEERDKLDEEDEKALQSVILNESARILADYISQLGINGGARAALN